MSDLPSEIVPAPVPEVDQFRISPLIRLTLMGLYLGLTLPLPFLPQTSEVRIPAVLLWLGIGLGFGVLLAALSEKVMLNQEGIRVTYPVWVPGFLRKGWSLAWSDVTALKPRSTGQGGLVYYLTNQAGQAFLLPMRVAGFARLVRRVQAETEIDTTDVKPLSQPWMYLLLLLLTLLLLAIDAWVIWTATTQLAG
ncbi:MAG: hypothetical protein ACKO24_14220 [Leptolyngbyaceae cyanobacterium]